MMRSILLYWPLWCCLLVVASLKPRGFGATSTTKKKRKISSPPVESQEAVASGQVKFDSWGLPVVDENAPVDLGSRGRAVTGSLALREAVAAEPGLFEGYVAVAREWHDRCTVLQVEPLVVRVHGFLLPEECDDVVDLSQSSTRAKEMAKDAGTFDTGAALRRTSTTFYVRFDEPEVLPLMARATSLFDTTMDRFEEVQVARYRGGDRFKWHEDAVPPPLLAADPSVDGGQRIATVLVYLSGEGKAKDGGATCFRDLGPLRVLPKKGDALLFFPSTGSRRTPDDRTIHAAEPAIAEKWVTQLWLHEASYPPTIIRPNPRGSDLIKRAADLKAPPSLDDGR